MKSQRFLAAVLLAYAWLFPWLPALRSPDEVSRLYQIRAIVDDHTLSVSSQVARRGPAGDLAERGGRLYPRRAPGLSLVGAPVYAALEVLRGGADRVSDRALVFFLRLLLCMLPGAAAAELLRRILLRRFAPPLASAGAGAFALGTIFWPYSTLLSSHGPTASALVAAWYFLDRAREHPDSPRPVRPERRPGFATWVARGGNYPLAGLFLGLAVLLEYASALGVLALAGYGLAGARRKGSAALHALAGLLPPLAALALYHGAAYGSPLATGYARLGASAPSLGMLVSSLAGPRRGLFAYSPFLALSVPGLFLLWGRDRALAVLCTGALALYGWFAASFTPEAWAWTVGPGHVVVLAAFLTPPALEAADRLRRSGFGMFAAALALSSIGGTALLMAAGPFFPRELTNPVHQLSVPLLEAGLHAHTILGMALGSASPWTLAPWALVVAAAGLGAALAFLPHGPEAVRLSSLSGAVALAAVLFLASGVLGGPDRFEETRRSMAAIWEPVPGRAPGVFAPP